MYICGIYTVNDRIRAGTFRIFSTDEKVKEWILNISFPNRKIKDLSSEEIKNCRYTLYGLSIQKVDEVDNIKSHNYRINPVDFMLKCLEQESMDK